MRAKQQVSRSVQGFDSAHQEVEMEIKILEWEVWFYKLDHKQEIVDLEELEEMANQKEVDQGPV